MKRTKEELINLINDVVEQLLFDLTLEDGTSLEHTKGMIKHVIKHYITDTQIDDSTNN